MTISLCPRKSCTEIAASRSPLRMTTISVSSSSFSLKSGTSNTSLREINGIVNSRYEIILLPCTFRIRLRLIIAVSRIEESGMAYFSEPICTIMAAIIDKVSGSCTEKLVPFPGVENIVTLPPSDVILDLTTSSPTPRPDTSEMTSAVLKPGANRIW
ncbi:hypothetical protein D1872_235240 [compost metagenome]